MKSTPTRGVKQFLKPDAYNQSELDWTLMTIRFVHVLIFGKSGMEDGRDICSSHVSVRNVGHAF